MTYISSKIEKLDALLYDHYYNNYFSKNYKHLNYGTAGFREKHYFLYNAAFRIGLFAAILSKHDILGVMITASHNYILDNGLKITSFTGNMMR